MHFLKNKVKYYYYYYIIHSFANLLIEIKAEYDLALLLIFLA